MDGSSFKLEEFGCHRHKSTKLFLGSCIRGRDTTENTALGAYRLDRESVLLKKVMSGFAMAVDICQTFYQSCLSRTPASRPLFQVQPEGFLRVLRKFNLHLRRKHLGLFLARCGLEVRRTGIDYPEFLRRFQDRSDEGVLHRILSDPKHKCVLCVDCSTFTDFSILQS